MNPAAVEAFNQRRQLRRRQPDHAVLDLRPAELVILKRLGEQTHAGSISKSASPGPLSWPETRYPFGRGRLAVTSDPVMLRS